MTYSELQKQWVSQYNVKKNQVVLYCKKPTEKDIEETGYTHGIPNIPEEYENKVGFISRINKDGITITIGFSIFEKELNVKVPFFCLRIVNDSRSNIWNISL